MALDPLPRLAFFCRLDSLLFLSFGAPVEDGWQRTLLPKAQFRKVLPITIQPQLSRELEGGGGHIKSTQASNAAIQSRVF